MIKEILQLLIGAWFVYILLIPTSSQGKKI